MVLLAAFAALHGQTCAPVRLLPADTVSASLDASSCLLSDGTAYQAYRLVLPARGQVQIALSNTTNNLGLMLRDASGAQVGSGLTIQQPIEAGSYTLLVNGMTPGQVGGYTVQTAFTPEPGMLCANFDSIGLNDTVSGRLGMSGCTPPSGLSYEAYSLTTLGSGTLSVSVSSPDFTPIVTVRASDGTAVASGGSVQATVYSGTQYEILISTSDIQGAYQVTTAFQPAPAETCVPQGAFSSDGSDNSTLTPANCSTASTYFTYYSLDVTTPGLADLSAVSTDFLPTLFLFDQSGNLIASDSGGGASPNSAGIRTQLGAGNYIVEVATTGSGGAYSFNYQFTAATPLPCTPNAASPNSTITGSLGPASCRDNSLGLADLYTINLPAAGLLDLTMTSAAFAAGLALRDTKDNLILATADQQDLGSTELTAELPAGTYTVAAAALSNSGSYQLTYKLTTQPVTPCTYVQAMDNNGGYIAKLGEGSCQGPNGQPLDFYQFTIPSDSVVLAVMTSSQVPGHLTLADSYGNFLRSDEDSYAPGDPAIIQYLPAGTYQLQARAAGSTSGGLYEVDVRTTPGPHPPFCAAQPGLKPGVPINAALNYTSCQYADSTFADLYSFTLNAPATISLELDSTAFNGYLILLDAIGNAIATADSYGAVSASLQQPLAAGTYIVVAKAEPYSGYYYSVGAYRLSLAAQ